MNFKYLEKFPNFKKLYEYCCEAEDFAITKPNISAMSSRKAMEFIVKFIYFANVPDALNGLTVFEMVSDPAFKEYINDDTLLSTIHYIRKMGNAAAHDGNLSVDEGLEVLEELHFLVGEFCIFLGLVDDYPVFEKPVAVKHSQEEEKKAAEKEKVVPEKEIVAYYTPRMRETRFNTNFKRDENENKKMFLHASFREAGWPVVNRKNQAMPCSAGIDILLDDGTQIDYVLYGRDNRPLAIVEYNSTNQNLIEGRMQGIKKADMLSKKLGYKPVVYYTNGYSIFIIDQLGYAPRRVFQFHSIEELELMKLRKTMRADITNPVIDDNITNRDYQKKAIKASCNAFSSFRRHSLLVMATGTGKTRVSISLVDVLMKANWIKNVLFLADRTSLVRQAHKNFNKLLPNVTTSIFTGSSEDRDSNARIIFSTYQTMINLVNDDTREFGIGRFDLIIIDEAHRSIFKKYGALFHYFDALMIGLTATPRNEDNKSTYEMFKIKNGEPDYAYELEEAIDDGYLVGFSIIDKTTSALERGIHYDDLSDEEKERWEDTFTVDDEETDFSGSVLDRYSLERNRVINLGTIDAMLNDLMKNGLKINGGDKIGKTIIFAKSHFMAEKIVERFQALYGYLGLNFCKLVDSKVDNNQTLIDNFTERDNEPQITVSVDMMDTGIDVPDILNLVFFKQVNSKIKFLQMIGRGTRLSPDIFGPGLNKKGFLIFDYYDNFNYFNTHNTWTTSKDRSDKSFNITPQSVLINQRKVGILRYLTERQRLSDFDKGYKTRLKDYFVTRMNALCNDDIEVQYNMAYVNKYRTAEQWDSFTDDKVKEIFKHILPLLPPEKDNVKVKTFDLMIYVIEDEGFKRNAQGKDVQKIRHGFGNVYKKIDDMLDELSKLKTIPEVLKKEQLIKSMHNSEYILEDFCLERCESARLGLRDLMSYIPDDADYHVINVKDYVIDDIEDPTEVVKEKTYAEKAQDYIQKGNTALAKIRSLDELTDDEKNELETAFKQKLGSEADYSLWSGNKPLLPFLRVQVGIAEEAISTKFGSFLNDKVMNEQQLTYMNQIIDYARENGDITFMELQRVSPFCDVDIMALFGQKIADIKTLINGLHRPVM